MKLRNIIILLMLMSVSTGCVRIFKYVRSGGYVKYFTSRAEIKFTGRPTGLDSLVNIDGEYCNELYITPARFYVDGRAKVGERYGLYKLSGDTIIVDTYYCLGTFMKRIYTFVIINPETIQLVKTISDDPVDGIEDLSPRLTQIYHLQLAKELKYDHYFDEIHKQKWLWESEEDWQRWMDAHKQERARNKVGEKDGQLLNELFDTMSAECFYQNKLFNIIGKMVKIEQPCAQNDSITLEEYLKAIADYQQLHGQISEQVRGSLHVNSYDEKRKSGGYDAVITLSAPPENKPIKSEFPGRGSMSRGRGTSNI